MKQKNISSVDITIGANMYGRISDLENTPSHVLAEFVDNALQSYLDNKKELLELEPNYKLRVDIEFHWNDNNHADRIIIHDNAGGINSENFVTAFKLANTPENNQGLNEFGMGMKTAALWLGKKWCLKTTALKEDVCRSITFNLDSVINDKLKEIDVTNEPTSLNTHYTEIIISNLTPKAPSQKVIQKIKIELSSIYRKWLRNNVIDIYVDNEKLVFEDIEILKAPFVKDINGKPIYWRKDINFKFGAYRATGFIGILKDINNTKNGLVLLRRGRVVYGAETDGRYFPKSICGSTGNFRYKRIFGELELEGFNVSFNKNGIQDKENLDALMVALQSEIHTKDFDLYTQAEEYRLDERQKSINRIIKKHDNKKKKADKVVIKTHYISNNSEDTHDGFVSDQDTISYGSFSDTYNINGKDYQLQVHLVNSGNDLVWLDTSLKNENIVICKINAKHKFFEYFKESDTVYAILKALVLAKFTAKENGNDSTAELFEHFNTYIKETKV